MSTEVPEQWISEAKSRHWDWAANGQQTLLKFLEIYFAVEIVGRLELLLILDNLPVPHQIIPIKKLLMN